MKISCMSFNAVLVLCLIISGTRVANGVEYYKIAMQWQIAYCNRGIVCANPPFEEFKIHGLWPYNADHTRINPPCPGDPFPTLKTVERWGRGNTKNQLERHWPSLTGSNYGFWKHEWEAHGICSGLKPFEYFSLGLFLAHDHLPLRSQLSDSLKQKKPMNPGFMYSREEIQNALLTITPGFLPEVECNWRRRVIQLHEANYCYSNTDPPTLRSCSNEFFDCGTETDRISFPSILSVPPANKDYEPAKNKTD